MYTVRPNEDINIAGSIQPNAGTAGTFLTAAIALGPDVGRRLMALLQTGTIGSSGTVAAGFTWSATSGGTYAAVTGAAITTDTTGGNIHQVIVGVDQIKNFAPTAEFVKFQVVTAVAATPFSALVQGFDGAHFPVSNAAPDASPTNANAQVVTTLA